MTLTLTMYLKSYLNRVSGEFCAEFLGTFILMSINNGVVAAYRLNHKVLQEDNYAEGVVAGIGAMTGIIASLPISGGHINPSVSVAFAVMGRFPWKKVPHYLLGQYLGSFVSCIFVYLTYLDGINALDGGIRSAYGTNTSTGAIFATYPGDHATIATVLMDQIFGTALLLMGVLAITDSKGLKIPIYLQPFIISLLIAGLVSSFGFNCGAVLNPARDIAPRIFTAISGWGIESFKPIGGNYWWVAGLVGPHLGAVLGCLIYRYLIDYHLKSEEITNETNNNIKMKTAMALIGSDVEGSKKERTRSISVCTSSLRKRGKSLIDDLDNDDSTNM